MEQNTMVEKMIKGPQIHPNKGHYMLNPMLYAIAILELILWHKYKQERKA